MTLILNAFVAAAGMLAFVLAPLQVAQAQDIPADPKAERFIADLAEKTLGAISDPSLDQEGRQSAFRRLLVGNTDIEKFGRSALGRYSRLPTQEQFALYLDVLEDYAVAILTSRFALFSDHQITVLGSQVKQGRRTRYVIVGTDLSNPEGRQVATIQWVLIDDGEAYRIFDIVLQAPGETGSFSLLKTQRDEFTQILRANGRDTDKLIADLRKRVVAGVQTEPVAAR